MFIVDSTLSRKDLLQKCEVKMEDDMIKGVADLGSKRIALDAPLHVDLETLLLQEGADQNDLWGFNLYPDEDEEFIEFDSMINIRPWQNNRSRGVENEETQEEIKEVISKWIK